MNVWWEMLSVLAPVVVVALLGTTVLYAMSRGQRLWAKSGVVKRPLEPMRICPPLPATYHGPPNSNRTTTSCETRTVSRLPTCIRRQRV